MEKKICFVIAPIGEPNSDTRKRSDQILKHVIAPAVEECGYHAVRADKISEPGLITSQVIQHIVDDPLVIADLTDRNPNVFYELAIRHAIRRPLVQIMKKGEPLPFDVAGTRTIPVDHRDLDSVEEAKKDIVNQIRAVEKNPTQIDTPISVSLDLQILKQSDNPEQRSLADILSALAELRKSISVIEQRLEQQPMIAISNPPWVQAGDAQFKYVHQPVTEDPRKTLLQDLRKFFSETETAKTIGASGGSVSPPRSAKKKASKTEE